MMANSISPNLILPPRQLSLFCVSHYTTRTVEVTMYRSLHQTPLGLSLACLLSLEAVAAAAIRVFQYLVVHTRKEALYPLRALFAQIYPSIVEHCCCCCIYQRATVHCSERRELRSHSILAAKLYIPSTVKTKMNLVYKSLGRLLYRKFLQFC